MSFFSKFFQREEKQHPLPIGRKQYDEWAKRVIEGAQVPGLTEDSAHFALTSMLLHLPSTQSFASDAKFVHSLRKGAINETAYAVMKELEIKMKKRKAEEAVQAAAEASNSLSGLTLVPPPPETK